jgi:hypothetical protein
MDARSPGWIVTDNHRTQAWRRKSAKTFIFELKATLAKVKLLSG